MAREGETGARLMNELNVNGGSDEWIELGNGNDLIEVNAFRSFSALFLTNLLLLYP